MATCQLAAGRNQLGNEEETEELEDMGSAAEI